MAGKANKLVGVESSVPCFTCNLEPGEHLQQLEYNSVVVEDSKRPAPKNLLYIYLPEWYQRTYSFENSYPYDD